MKAIFQRIFILKEQRYPAMECLAELERVKTISRKPIMQSALKTVARRLKVSLKASVFR